MTGALITGTRPAWFPVAAVVELTAAIATLARRHRGQVAIEMSARAVHASVFVDGERVCAQCAAPIEERVTRVSVAAGNPRKSRNSILISLCSECRL